MTKYYTLVLLLSLTFLSACGAAPGSTNSKLVSCPAEPTMCGPSDVYSILCYNYDTYEQMGYDVSEAARKCNLAHIVRD